MVGGRRPPCPGRGTSSRTLSSPTSGPAFACIALLVTSAAAGALPAAAATGTLFGADQQAQPKLQLDDDVHAAAADAAAKWQQRVNHIFGSVGIDTRRRASAFFGTAVPGISPQLLADVADAAEGSPAAHPKSTAALPCLNDDGSVAGGGAAGCRPGTLEKPLDPAGGGKAALLAHHMYQQRDTGFRDDVALARAEQQQRDHEQQQQQQQSGKQHMRNLSQGAETHAASGHGSLLQGGLAVAEAGLVAAVPSVKATARLTSKMQPLTVHSRIVDTALDDHLQHLDVVEARRLPAADGPDSTLRGWEAADEGGALGFGFQHLPADQVHQQRPDAGWWVGLLLRLTLAAGCAVCVAGLYAIRCRVASQRVQVGVRYGDGKRLPLLSTPVPVVASAKGDDVMQPGTPESATCRPRRLEADLDMASPPAPCPDGSLRIGPPHDGSPVSGKPRPGAHFHLQAFAGGLTILPPQPPFATPLSSLATSCSYTDPSPLGIGSPLSLASPSPSPQRVSSAQSPPRQHLAKHARWDAPSPEWPVLSPGVPRSFRG